MKLATKLSIDRTVIGADSTVRPAELAMMINVPMLTPSAERIPCAAYCHDACWSSKLARFPFLEAFLVTSLNVLVEYTLSFPANHWIRFQFPQRVAGALIRFL